MAPKYKLIYFNAVGYGDVARLILAHSEVGYEDVRINRADWPEIKQQQPFGKLPVLEVDGQKLAESGAIFAFLGKEHGLAGNSNFEAARCAMIWSALKDLLTERFSSDKDEARKEELRKTYVNEKLPLFLNQLEKILTDNGGTYLVGKRMTYADLAVVCVLGELQKDLPNMLDNYKAIQSLIDHIHSFTATKHWAEIK